MTAHSRQWPDGPDNTASDSLLTRIVEEIAAERGVDPLDVQPLQEDVAVEAVVELVVSTMQPNPDQMRISLKAEEQLVSVLGDGSVELSSLVRAAAETEDVRTE